MFYEMQKVGFLLFFYGAVSLPFIGWRVIAELHFGSPPKTQEGGAKISPSSFCLGQVSPSRCSAAPSLALLSADFIFVCSGKIQQSFVQFRVVFNELSNDKN